MRLEVLVDSEDPRIFPLNQSEILIGSGESCDIILDADGISRKHVKVLSSGDQFFVVDQGSTNGTYINEERLIPGRKTDFTSFFPVRLGDKVFLTLLSDEEAGDSELSTFAKKIEEREKSFNLDSSDSTRAFSVNDLNKTPRNLELQQAKKTKSKTVAKKPIPKAKKEKNSMGVTGIAVFFLFAFAIYYQFNQKQDALVTKEENQVPGPEKKSTETTPAVKEAPKIDWKISDDELISKTKMEIYLNDLKCFNPEEKNFCDLMPNKSEKDGAIQVGESFVFLIEQKKLITAAKQLLQIKGEQQAPGDVSVYSSEIYKLGLLLALRTLLTLKSTQSFKNINFYIAIYDENAKENIIKKVLAIKQVSLEQLVPYLDDFNMSRIKQYGPHAIKDSEIYYTIY